MTATPRYPMPLTEAYDKQAKRIAELEAKLLRNTEKWAKAAVNVAALEAERDAKQAQIDRLVSGAWIESDTMTSKDVQLLAVIAERDALRDCVGRIRERVCATRDEYMQESRYAINDAIDIIDEETAKVQP